VGGADNQGRGAGTASAPPFRFLGVKVVLILAAAWLLLVPSGQAGGERCRTLSVLRFKGDLYFHHRLAVPRPALGRRQGVGLERACDDTPGDEPPPWVGVTVFTLRDVRTAVAIAPRRSQVVFYNPYFCSPRLSETRFLRCLRRR
jgi:hypothetical protein